MRGGTGAALPGTGVTVRVSGPAAERTRFCRLRLEDVRVGRPGAEFGHLRPRGVGGNEGLHSGESGLRAAESGRNRRIHSPEA